MICQYGRFSGTNNEMSSACQPMKTFKNLNDLMDQQMFSSLSRKLSFLSQKLFLTIRRQWCISQQLAVSQIQHLLHLQPVPWSFLQIRELRCDLCFYECVVATTWGTNVLQLMCYTARKIQPSRIQCHRPSQLHDHNHWTVAFFQIHRIIVASMVLVRHQRRFYITLRLVQFSCHAETDD